MIVSTFHIANYIGVNQTINAFFAILVSPYFTHELLTIMTLRLHQDFFSQLLANTSTIEKARHLIYCTIGGSRLL